MAKQKGKTKNKKWIWWVVCLVLLVIVGAGTFVVWKTIFKERDEGQQNIVTEEAESQIEKKISGNGGVIRDEADEESGGKKVVQYEGEDPNNSEKLTGVVTYTGRIGGEGSDIQILTNIDQFLSGGTCEITISQNGKTVYSGNSGIQPGVSTSSCDGFVVPGSAIGNGAAQININLSSGDRTGTITTEVTL